ncbi:MAG: AAA family ATPase [Burkholderiales bacterium]|nr:AAA family ATPase [Burkholderiales bacterium]
MTDSAAAPRTLTFGPFALDTAAVRLTRGGQDIALTPRAFDLLRVLVSRAGELVTKDELLDSVWGTRFVTEGVIKTAVSQLRSALGEGASRASWIETVPRRGYRFVRGDAAVPPLVPASTPAAGPGAASPGLIGREGPLALLQQAWQQVRGGQGRLVFIAGDPGVGKSALAAAFVEGIDAAVVGHGQCIESFGREEPYRPWLDLLSSLARQIEDLPAHLARCAPSWLAQLPWLQSGAAAAGGEPALAADRMPRELAELLDQLARRAPLLLVLEDLHWSDTASVQLIDALARRRPAAPVLLLATFRATELALGEHALADIRRELRLHELAGEIYLDGLDADATRALLEAWHAGARWNARAVKALHDHTEGVPLFLRAVLDTLVSDGVLREAAPGAWQLATELPARLPLPERLAGLYERQFAALAPVQRELLEAAAVAGVEFDAAVLAHALERELADVDDHCDGLVRGGRWLRAAGLATPAGAEPAGRYRFGHALMHGLAYERCGPARRVRLHGRVAAAMAARYTASDDEMALELAYHHEQALDAPRALPCLHRALRQAMLRQAPREVLSLCTRALALLPACEGRVDAAQLAAWRCEMLGGRATGLSQVDGPGSPAHHGAIAQALQAHEGAALGQLLLNLLRIQWLHLVVGGCFADALALAEDVVRRADEGGDAACRVQALSMLHFSAFKRGAFARAREAIAEAERLAPMVQPLNEAFARFFAQQAHERALMTALMAAAVTAPVTTPLTTPVSAPPANPRPHRPQAVPQAVRDFPADAYSAVGRVFNGLLAQLCLAWHGEAAAVRAAAADMARLIEREQVVAPIVAAHRVLAHWAEGVLGTPARALPALRAALDEVVASAHVAERAALYELAADLALRCDRLDIAASDIDRAFAHVQATGESYLEARLWARRAQIAAVRGDPAEQRRCQGRADDASAALS